MDPIKAPADGFNSYEMIILQDLIITVYENIADPQDKFILCSIYECGYKQEDVARMLGCTQAKVSKRLNQLLKKVRNMRMNGKL